MSSAKTHGRNLMLNWASHAASIVILFFLSPFVLHSLGQVEFGLWSLLTVLTGYMGVLDLGVRASTGRHIALYLGKGDERGVDETIRTSLGFYSASGFVVVLVGLGLGWAFPSLFSSVPEEYHTVAKWLLPFLALNVWLSAIGAVYSSVLSSYDRFDLTRGVDLAVLAVRTTATVVVLSAGHGIVGLAIVNVAGQVLALVGNFILAKRIHKKLRTWPFLMTRSRIRELLGYGLAAFISAVSVKIIGQTDLIIAGAAISVDAVAVFSVGAMLVYYSNSFLTHIGTTLFPEMQRAVARGERGPVRWLFLRAARLQIAIGVLAYGGMIAFAEPFIRLWMYGPDFGDDSVRQAATVMQILALSKLPLLFVGSSGAVLNAMGKVRLTASTTAAEAGLNLVLSLLFVLGFDWGLNGIAIGTLVARLAIGTFIVPWCACSRLGLDWTRYLLWIGGTELVVVTLFSAVCYAVISIVSPSTWPIFLGEVALISLVYCAIAFAILIPPEVRQHISRRLRLSQS
jgi:O-antigen/teichoic acid export membrane protein